MTESAIRSPLATAWAGAWLERWDRQQQAYVAGREARFRTMVEAVRELAGETPLVVDLACGPGSLARRLLDGIPDATVIAVDLDPLLLAVGKAVLGGSDGRLTWVEANLSDPAWSRALGVERVDAVVSTTALHWLEVPALLSLYRDLATLLPPGGLVLNGDQMEHPPTERRIGEAARAIRERRTATAFAAPDVTEYWDHYAELRARPELAALVAERDRRFTAPRPAWAAGYELHRAALLNAGFAEVGTIWQDLDNRVLAAIR